MRVAVEIAGRTRQVDVRPGEVTVDGRTMAVDVAPAGHWWSLLVGERAKTSYEIAVTEQPGGELVVRIDGRRVVVAIAGSTLTFGAAARRQRLTDGMGASRTGGEGSPRFIVAPMPGRIIQVLAAVGDVVAAHQGLVVIEAMKMENELRSPRAGRISEVRVTKGALVEAHAVLVVVD